MRGSGFLLGVLCSGLDLNKKFRQYCKVRWENNTAELTTADPRAIEEFYPEFPELYDYFFSLGEVKEPAHPINEGYLNVSKILSLKINCKCRRQCSYKSKLVAVLHSLKESQIGRASWRERV